MKGTRQNAERLAAKLCATLEIDKGAYLAWLWTPAKSGLVWRDTGTHCAGCATEDRQSMAYVYDHAIRIMQGGMEPCTDLDCDICLDENQP